jgi:hypothetical protein
MSDNDRIATERSSASPRWGLWQRHWVRTGGQLLLERLQVAQSPWFSVLLTHIRKPDNGRDPHDHSRWFASIIVSGGYCEEVFTDSSDLSKRHHRSHGRWSLHVMKPEDAHLITAVKEPLVTLVIAGRHRGTWSFWTPAGKVDWKRYGLLYRQLWPAGE